MATLLPASGCSRSLQQQPGQQQSGQRDEQQSNRLSSTSTTTTTQPADMASQGAVRRLQSLSPKNVAVSLLLGSTNRPQQSSPTAHHSTHLLTSSISSTMPNGAQGPCSSSSSSTSAAAAAVAAAAAAAARQRRSHAAAGRTAKQAEMSICAAVCPCTQTQSVPAAPLPPNLPALPCAQSCCRGGHLPLLLPALPQPLRRTAAPSGQGWSAALTGCCSRPHQPPAAHHGQQWRGTPPPPAPHMCRPADKSGVQCASVC
jgi:MYXO-CTERM domain-containing protein